MPAPSSAGFIWFISFQAFQHLVYLIWLASFQRLAVFIKFSLGINLRFFVAHLTAMQQNLAFVEGKEVVQLLLPVGQCIALRCNACSSANSKYWFTMRFK